MASVNKIILVGNLGRDPELRQTNSGKPVCSFSLACSESSGGKSEHTEWFNIVVWDKLAELCAQYLSKGRQAYVEGRQRTREYEDKDGNKRKIAEIHAQVVQFLDSGRSRDQSSSDSPPTSSDEIPW